MEPVRLKKTGEPQKALVFDSIGGALSIFFRITFKRTWAQKGGVAGSHMEGNLPVEQRLASNSLSVVAVGSPRLFVFLDVDI